MAVTDGSALKSANAPGAYAALLLYAGPALAQYDFVEFAAPAPDAGITTSLRMELHAVLWVLRNTSPDHFLHIIIDNALVAGGLA